MLRYGNYLQVQKADLAERRVTGCNFTLSCFVQLDKNAFRREEAQVSQDRLERAAAETGVRARHDWEVR